MQLRQGALLSQFADVHVGMAAIEQTHHEAPAVGVFFDCLSIEIVKNRDAGLKLPEERRAQVG